MAGAQPKDLPPITPESVAVYIAAYMREHDSKLPPVRTIAWDGFKRKSTITLRDRLKDAIAAGLIIQTARGQYRAVGENYKEREAEVRHGKHDTPGRTVT